MTIVKGNSLKDPVTALFELAPIGVVMIEENGQILKVNAIFSRFIGYTEEELLQMSVHEFTHPEDRIITSKRLTFIDQAPATFHMEKRYLHKEGHIIWGLVQGLSKNSDISQQHTTNYIALIQDITQIKRQEEELRATKEKYESFIQNSSDAIMIYDLEGHVLQVNKAFTQLSGWQEDEVMGVKLPITSSDQRLKFEGIIHKVILGQFVHNLETVQKHKDGTDIEVSMSVSPIRNVHGDVIMLAAILRDLTVQKALSRQAKQHEASFKHLVENWPDAFMIVKKGVWVYSNPAGLALLGASQAEQVIGHSVCTFHDPEEHPDIQKRLAKGHQGKIYRAQLQKFTRLDGQTIHVEMTSIPAVYEDEPAFHLLLRDVTEHIKTEELMRVSDKLNAVGQLAAGIAHEIRNPLTAIKGFVQLTQIRYPDSHHYFDIIRSEIERIELITGELLLLAKPSLKTEQAMDLCEIINQVSPLVETQGMLNNVQIVRDFKANHLAVLCDSNQLKQVFINLLKNAIEAMPSGGEIKIVVELEEGNIKVTITDQGPGIPFDQLSSIGQPFFTTKLNGTGLGLVVSYKIIQNHGGTISVENMPDQGAAFTIKLPRVGSDSGDSH
ncbi:PAS domain S-box protein [Paenibacillus sp. SYP-B3998]|uniref:histidine kinase n=1 Tax=Paenibacillus sp. SYP-B3998 TaxID=2678564 RepID=A0A6G4A175_9BACL|nr:PAS domain S-box protein [Paenibacillus sp. SYP-B3998]NEW08125.1 PAS domain S-box protein [Paenibacillus sp. SYP-B3998]